MTKHVFGGGAYKGPCVREVFIFPYFLLYISSLLFLNVYGVWVWVGGVGWGVRTSLCSSSPYGFGLVGWGGGV